MENILSFIHHFLEKNELSSDCSSFFIENCSKITRRPYAGDLTNIEVMFTLTKWAAKRDAKLAKVLVEGTAHLPVDSEIEERAFALLTNNVDFLCDRGNHRLLKSLQLGYGFCGNDTVCVCKKETHSQKFQARSSADKQAIKDKRKATHIEKYGVENAMLYQDCKDKLRKSYLDDTEKVRSAVQKTKAAVQKMYGVDNAFQSEVVKQKSRETMISKYGVDNPAKLPEFIKKAEDTYFAATGYRNSSHNPDALQKRASTNLERYGAVNPYQSEIIKARIMTRVRERYDVEFVQHQFYSPETLNILLDVEAFKQFIAGKSANRVADELSINYSTYFRYCRKYDIPVKESSYETEIAAFLTEHNISFIHGSRMIIPPRELDFYLPDYQVAIEFCGLWHRSDSPHGRDDPKYHKNKWIASQSKGIQLLTIFENEWLERSEIIKRKILNLCQQSERGVGARKLTITEIANTVAIEFVEKHHLQGSPQGLDVCYGAYDAERLVAVMMMGRQRTTKIAELKRFCTDGRVYSGVFSRIFSAYVKAHQPTKIVTFADLRYSNGNLYEKTGFVRGEIIKPDYKYVKGAKVFHKSNFTKKKIHKRFGIEVRTEPEAMKSLKFYRIFDCGKIRYTWNVP